MLYRSLILLSFAPALAQAADDVAKRTLPPSSVGGGDLLGSLGQMLLGLLVVVAVLVACLWLLKRISAPRGGARGLRVLGATPVGQRERVVLVEVADKVLVLGVAPGRVNTLHTLDPSQLPGLQAPAGPPPETGGFAGRLKQMMEARKHG